MVEIRTDLAEELRVYAKGESKDELGGIRFSEKTENAVRISTVDVLNEDGMRALGKPCGRYVTLTYGGTDALYGSFYTLCDTLAKEIRALCGSPSRLLVLGLGNRALAADAVGVMAADHVFSTHRMCVEAEAWFRESGLFDVAVLTPGVMAENGMETSAFVHFAVEDLRPDVMIAIDSLVAADGTRLARTIQLSDTGIIPGSGLGKKRGALTRETLGIPVIAIGVPTVVETSTLIRNAVEKAEFSSVSSSFSGFFVCPKDIDVIVRTTGKLIGFAVSRAFQTSLSYEDLIVL